MSLTVNKPKVLIIGDSFIRRLGDWMERTNSDFSGSVDTKLHGVGGRRVRTLQNFDLYVVAKYKPDPVFLQIGENDIRTVSSAATTIANNILQQARTIRSMKVPKVVIGSNIIRPKPGQMKKNSYDKQKKKINEELSKVEERGMKYWRHPNSWQKSRFFHRDGVHLNDEGHFKFFCSIRMCIGSYL
jgi:lysophospholipase L1-like esterase